MRRLVAVFVAFAVAISLVSAIRSNYDASSNKITFEIDKAGWYIFPLMGLREGNCKDMIQSAWLWSPTLKKYLGGKDDKAIDPDDNKKLLEDSNNYYAYAHEMFGGAWAYMSGECSTGGTYDLERYKWFRDNVGKLQLAKGWNLFAITPVMWGKTMNVIKGDCKIAALAVWDMDKQNWDVEKGEAIQTAMDHRMEKYNTGAHLWLKAENDCTLDFNPVIAPPPIPTIPD